MGEDREKITLDEDEAVREAVRGGEDVEGHAVTADEREAVSADDVEGHALISDSAVRDEAVRAE